MLSILRDILKCQRAATPLEYMLIAALLGLAVLQVSELAGPPLG